MRVKIHEPLEKLVQASAEGARAVLYSARSLRQKDRVMFLQTGIEKRISATRPTVIRLRRSTARCPTGPFLLGNAGLIRGFRNKGERKNGRFFEFG